MPIKACQLDGKSGYKWGDSGKCYTYTKGDEDSRTAALVKANLQRRAIKASESRKK